MVIRNTIAVARDISISYFAFQCDTVILNQQYRVHQAAWSIILGSVVINYSHLRPFS